MEQYSFSIFIQNIRQLSASLGGLCATLRIMGYSGMLLLSLSYPGLYTHFRFIYKTSKETFFSKKFYILGCLNVNINYVLHINGCEFGTPNKLKIKQIEGGLLLCMCMHMATTYPDYIKCGLLLSFEYRYEYASTTTIT